MQLKTLNFQLISEMAKPLSKHLATTFYHGTSTHKAAKSIIKSGKIKVPDLKDRSGSLKPIDGFVYMTPDKSYAQIYALGGAMAGTDYFLSGRGAKEDKYGFIFVINNKDLKDIQPDEDSVGELIAMVYAKKPSHWLISLAQDHLSDVTMGDLGYNVDDWIRDTSVFDLVIDEEYEAFAAAGKELMKYLSDKQKLDIIDLGVHLANKGSVSFSEVWRLDKSKAKELKASGSNLEKIVDKDKTGKKFLKDL
jgi:hypothetical protein